MKQGDINWIPGYGVRCNNCFMYFEDDDDVPLIEVQEEGAGWEVHGCPNCKTDAYLMDSPEYVGGFWHEHGSDTGRPEAVTWSAYVEGDASEEDVAVIAGCLHDVPSSRSTVLRSEKWIRVEFNFPESAKEAAFWRIYRNGAYILELYKELQLGDRLIEEFEEDLNTEMKRYFDEEGE